jgi:UDP-N-acetylmuramoylalanine--D-glutamate ligase
MHAEPGRIYGGRTVLVVGAGRSGTAAAEFLLRAGARVILSELRGDEEMRRSLAPLAALAGDLVLELGGHRRESFAACDLVVLSPGVPASLPELEASRARGIPIIAEVELACRHLEGTLIGITGSNGKTTTTTLACEILCASGLRARAAGNIGVPLIRFVPESRPGDIYVVELSSFQLEFIDRLRPAVAAILNLTPDHLDRHAGFAAYVEIKRRIFANQTAADLAVLNADDRPTRALEAGIRASIAFFSRKEEVARGAFLRAGRAIYRDARGERELFAAAQVRMRGDHNLENALAACAVAVPAGAAPESAARVVSTFRGVEHRLEWVADIDGVSYFNDSKATNVDAALRALAAFPGNLLWIAGGRDKGGDFTLLEPLVRSKVKHLVLLGEAAGKIREALGRAAEITEARSLPEAVELCRRMAQPGDTVLLAPACASFDMFRNYEERGRVFKEAVRNLESKR